MTSQLHITTSLFAFAHSYTSSTKQVVMTNLTQQDELLYQPILQQVVTEIP